MIHARKRSALLASTVVAGSLLGSLLAAELVLRWVAPVSFMQPPPLLREWRTLLHRRSRIRGLAYELRPNAAGKHDGIAIRTNSWGMRDREPLAPGAAGNRVIVLGDSFTFGFGVEQRDTYPEVLERLLAGDRQGPVEVLNAGVGGYSTRDEALLLRHRLAALHPELVIVGYVMNDPEIDAVQPLHAYYASVALWQRSHLLRKIAELRYQHRHGRRANYLLRLHADARKWGSVLAAFDDIRSLAAREGFATLLVQFPEVPRREWLRRYPFTAVHRQVARAAKARGFAVLDLSASFRRHRARSLRLSPRDHHLTVLGHRLAAEAIRDYLAQHPELLAGGR